MIDVCPLTELPPAQCACRNHRGGQVPELETVGQPLEARFSGTCGRCYREIVPGEMIVRAADRGCGYLHVRRCYP